MATLKRLDTFWLHSNCPAKFKMQAFNAIIQTKLLYGLESAVIPEGIQRKLDTFQLKGLRKILNLKTTFVERANTNERVYEIANAAAGYKEDRQITSFSKTYKAARLKMGKKVFSRETDDPLRFSTIHGNTGEEAFYDFFNKRIGRPKEKWSQAVAQDILEERTSSTENGQLAHEQFQKKIGSHHNTELLRKLLRDLRNS